jgi:hypothetical protein
MVCLAGAVAASCTTRVHGHDLRVSNAWVRDMTIQVSIEPLAPKEQRTTLGDVRAGETVVFSEALREQEQYVIHGRYDSNGWEFDTICLTPESLEQAGRSVTIPGTPSTCRAH